MGVTMKALARITLVTLLLISFSVSIYAQEAVWEELMDQSDELYQQGRYSEAARVTEEALKIAEKTPGPGHSNVSTTLFRLAAIYRAQEKHTEAEDLYRRATGIADKFPTWLFTVVVLVVVLPFILVMFVLFCFAVAGTMRSWRSGQIARTRSLMRVSWLLLRNDKEILIFPFIDLICCILIVAMFLNPSFAGGILWMDSSSSSIDQKVLYYGVLFLCFLCQYLVIVFFNSAIIACAAIRMGGKDPQVSDGFRAAIARFPLVAMWALVLAGASLVTAIIRKEDKSGYGGIAASSLEKFGSVVSFLVVPIIVLERKGPFSALQESTSLLKKTWGEQLVFEFSFGTVSFFLSIIGLIPIIAVFLVGVAVPFDSLAGTIMLSTAGLSVIYLIGLGVIHSALRSIFKTALYLYARDGEVPAGFQLEMLRNAIRPE